MKVVISSLLLFVLLLSACKKNDDGNNNNNNNNNNPGTTEPKTELGKELNCDCDPKDFASAKVTYTHAIMKPEDVAYILPLGLMMKGHVTPIDHQYYYPHGVVEPTPPVAPVYSPADGYVVKLVHMSQQVEPHLPPRVRYDVLIQHSCEVYTYYQLVTGLTDELKAELVGVEEGKDKVVKIAVKAGDKVGEISGQSLDVTVFDQNTPAKKWIVPSHYTEMGKKWKTDAFLYYTDAVKQSLKAKTIRTGEPLGGRFDYDEDGKLVGSWFLQGTNGYNGIQSEGYDYWRGHLSFAYFVQNISAVEVSIGRWNKPGANDVDIKGGWQFAVKNNGPDPKDVTVSTGMVKYELTKPGFIRQDNNQPWGQQTFEGQINITSGASEGILLVQMIENGLIKVEAFPGKTAAEVTGFTADAKLYER